VEQTLNPRKVRGGTQVRVLVMPVRKELYDVVNSERLDEIWRADMAMAMKIRSQQWSGGESWP
jgi:hypothetical protein